MAVRADDGAARAFAQVARAGVSMSAAAREALRPLYVRSDRAPATSFDAWMASLTWNPPEPPQSDASALKPARYAGSQACRECHAQSAVHDAQPDGAVNYSIGGAGTRTYTMELPSSFSRKAFYRDGRHRATTFVSESFARSECFRKGGATCGACHDPHPSDATTNLTSLKYRNDSNAMCVQCHTGFDDRPEQHTRHAPASEATRCVSCHMPRIMDALLFPARTHEIDDVPDVEMTERFGQADSPNACLVCHKDRDVKRLREAMKRRG
jgi:predicted CXXCH cytochrome family protein